MNIFILDLDPKRNAEFHVDKHVGKMILESAQLLCTTFHTQGIIAPYRSTHVNHPCRVFTGAAKQNFDYVISYALALHDEYHFRFGKLHKSFEVVSWCINHKYLLSFDSESLTPFALAMPGDYKCKDAVDSYRNYYNSEKSHMFKWTKRNPPLWVKMS